MAKIKLGQRPETFRKTVKFSLIEGGEGAIECIYKYRTRSEFGAFIDEVMNEAKVAPKESDDGEKSFSMKELMEKTAGSNADYIMRVLKGWSLEEDFTHENVQRLADEFPAAATAIMDTYASAVRDGRLGN